MEGDGGGTGNLVQSSEDSTLANIMLKAVVVVFLVTSCLGQQLAKQKCAEYSALAKSNKNSPQCTALSGDKSGVKIEPNEFPATAMLGYAAPNSSEVRYLCDATLISEDTLLAAGHCLRQTKYGSPKWARLGATWSTLGVELEVKEALCHPKYNPGHDIALVKLKEAVNSSFVPACLDTEGPRAGETGVGVGRPIGSAYKELREHCPIKSRLEVKPNQDCLSEFPKQNITSEATLCTKDPANGPGDCLSGPLYVSRETCVHTVIGLASFGKPCYNETALGRTPSVYTKVSQYLPWIESVAWPSTA